jgi:hypothetical protein
LRIVLRRFYLLSLTYFSDDCGSNNVWRMLHIQPTSGHDVKFNLLKSKRKRFLLRRDTKLLTNWFQVPNI